MAALALFRIGLHRWWRVGERRRAVSETWAAEHRGKALGFMQSAWAIGYAAAAAVNGLVLPRYGWRAVFFVGILPALLTFWIRRHVSEPTVWQETRRAGSPRRLAAMFEGPMLPLTAAVTVMNAFCLFAWWGFNQWVPNYLSTPVAAGGIGLSTETMSAFVIAMQVGMWFGYVTFGYIADAIGRKRTYVFYLVAAAVLIAAYVSVKLPTALLLLGPLVAFFATGFFSGFGGDRRDLSDQHPRDGAGSRITWAGLPAPPRRITGPWHRAAACAAPVTSVAYLRRATWTFIPETKGRELIADGARLTLRARSTLSRARSDAQYDILMLKGSGHDRQESSPASRADLLTLSRRIRGPTAERARMGRVRPARPRAGDRVEVHTAGVVTSIKPL